MSIITGLSGNEIFCLRRQGFTPGDLVIGNSVISLGVLNTIGSGIQTLIGGEVTPITQLIHEGRQRAYARMVKEATHHGGIGITGVSNELIFHGSNVEFLSIGSCIHQAGDKTEHLEFSSSADGQALYCQIDSGFKPRQFVFGNVAYSIGLGGGLLGSLKSLARGEIKEYSRIFNETRHLALKRIKDEARQVGANAVVGIITSIIPLAAMQEMVMIGTASHHPTLPDVYRQNPITSDLTNEEMWNLVNDGYMPVQLVLGVSVYSSGLIGSIISSFKSLVRGEIKELTTLIYEAREEALKHIEEDAQRCGADLVVGIKTYVYDLGGGIIEFMAIGTAVKKIPNVHTISENLIPQAIIRDQDTFIRTIPNAFASSLNQPKNNSSAIGVAVAVVPLVLCFLWGLFTIVYRF
jgi:uncharacterized protein YbjQ (UPF0145 family)